jgi:hypothetical protein
VSAAERKRFGDADGFLPIIVTPLEWLPPAQLVAKNWTIKTQKRPEPRNADLQAVHERVSLLSFR